MEQFIKVNGLAKRSKVLVCRCGLMVLVMKDTGLITRHRARENFGM